MADPPLWLFADQLGPHVHGDREIVLVESARALRRKPFHRQKLQLVLSGMRHLAAELGDRARYLRTDTYREALEQVGRPVLVHEPTSHAAADLVERLRTDGLVAEILPTPTFALSARSSPTGRGIAPRSGWRSSTAPNGSASTC